MITYLFEGAQYTFAEICAMVPRLNRSTVRRFLAQGLNTRKAMLEYTPNWTRLAQQRRTPFNKYDQERDHGRREDPRRPAEGAGQPVRADVCAETLETVNDGGTARPPEG